MLSTTEAMDRSSSDGLRSGPLPCKPCANGHGRCNRTEPSDHAHGGTTMPDAWSDKRERQYEHIKESYEDRGVSNDEAEERAARTVNKERSEAGETKTQRKGRKR